VTLAETSMRGSLRMAGDGTGAGEPLVGCRCCGWDALGDDGLGGGGHVRSSKVLPSELE
jgi:hypothetical protein